MNSNLNTTFHQDPALEALTAALYRFTDYQDMIRAVDKLVNAGIDTYHVNSDLSLTVWL